MSKESNGQPVNFEVAEDVVVGGVIVIRRGALGIGHFTDVEKTKMMGRHAQVEFDFDSVTAVDGQKIPVASEAEKTRGGRHNDTYESVSGGLVTIWMHGTDVLIRAGTGYDLVTSGQHTVQGGK
jgi:hypothetical protein